VLAPISRTDFEVRTDAPSFSVVVAARNAEATIGEAIESALGQTSPPLEVIVCDDGSTDGTAGVVERYTPRVRLVRQPPLGVSAARNAATRAAAGEFVVVLDSDDVYEPERLEALGHAARLRPDLDLITTDAYIELAGRVVGTWSGLHHAFPVDDQRHEILRRCFLFPHVAVRRETLLAGGGFDEHLPLAVDWDCWIRLILAGSLAGCVDAPLARYCITPGSLMSDSLRHIRGRVAVFEKLAGRRDLDGTVRELVAERLEQLRRDAQLVETEQALFDGDRTTFRSGSRAIARSTRFPLRTRVKALAASVAPGIALSLANRRIDEEGFTRTGRAVPDARRWAVHEQDGHDRHARRRG